MFIPITIPWSLIKFKLALSYFYFNYFYVLLLFYFLILLIFQVLVKKKVKKISIWVIFYKKSPIFKKIINIISEILTHKELLIVSIVTPHLIKYAKLKECHDKDNIKTRSGFNSIQPIAHHAAQHKLEERLTRVDKTKDEQIHGSQP